MIRSVILFVALTVAAYGYDETRMLAVIRQVETGDDSSVRGAAGERGAYQITPAVWHQHMGAQPFSDAAIPAYADACALKHLRWLADGMRRAGVSPTPARLALAWNYGLQGALRREMRLTDYARRAANLYASR